MQYRTIADLNLYDSPELKSLDTQAAKGRHLILLEASPATPTRVQLCDDDYSAWLDPQDYALLEPAPAPYQPIAVTEAEIRDRLPQAIAFTQSAHAVPNEYLWGGTVAPNYDCSGLMQAAFASVGVQLPRNAYQQEAFLQAIDLSELQPGDLVFFGPPEKAKHVGLYLGDNRYIHSSGKDIGLNGIGISELTDQSDTVSRNYYVQLRGAGRVVKSYRPGDGTV